MKWDNDAGVWQAFQVHLVLTTGGDKGRKKLGHTQSYSICYTAIYTLCHQTDLQTKLCPILLQPELVHHNIYSTYYSWISLVIHFPTHS